MMATDVIATMATGGTIRTMVKEKEFEIVVPDVVLKDPVLTEFQKTLFGRIWELSDHGRKGFDKTAADFFGYFGLGKTSSAIADGLRVLEERSYIARYKYQAQDGLAKSAIFIKDGNTDKVMAEFKEKQPVYVPKVKGPAPQPAKTRPPEKRKPEKRKPEIEKPQPPVKAKPPESEINLLRREIEAPRNRELLASIFEETIQYHLVDRLNDRVRNDPIDELADVIADVNEAFTMIVQQHLKERLAAARLKALQ